MCDCVCDFSLVLGTLYVCVCDFSLVLGTLYVCVIVCVILV